MMLSGGEGQQGSQRLSHLGSSRWTHRPVEKPPPLRPQGLCHKEAHFVGWAPPTPAPTLPLSRLPAGTFAARERQEELPKRHKLKRRMRACARLCLHPWNPRCAAASAGHAPGERDRARSPGTGSRFSLGPGWQALQRRSRNHPQLWRPCGPGGPGCRPTHSIFAWFLELILQAGSQTHCSRLPANSCCLLGLPIQLPLPWGSGIQVVLMLGLGPPSPSLPTPGHSIRSWTA